jgi:hypothetical protein
MAERKPTRTARRLVAQRLKHFFDVLVGELSHGAEEIWRRAAARAQSAEPVGHRSPNEHQSRDNP